MSGCCNRDPYDTICFFIVTKTHHIHYCTNAESWWRFPWKLPYSLLWAWPEQTVIQFIRWFKTWNVWRWANPAEWLVPENFHVKSVRFCRTFWSLWQAAFKMTCFVVDQRTCWWSLDLFGFCYWHAWYWFKFLLLWSDMVSAHSTSMNAFCFVNLVADDSRDISRMQDELTYSAAYSWWI